MLLRSRVQSLSRSVLGIDDHCGRSFNDKQKKSVALNIFLQKAEEVQTWITGVF